MKRTIAVFGATGNLGNKICRELSKNDATVIAVVRPASDPEKVRTLKELGIAIREVDLTDVNAIATALSGVDCVVSAVAGLREVVVDLQKIMLDGALQAGVPRFIPSDFCTDYNDLVPGENRNFDLRREFKTYLDSKAIKSTSIFNGAFADILKYNTPILNLKDKSIGYWGDKNNWKLDFTTMDDTAAFTARVALDDDAPRNLQIASFQVSPNDLYIDVKTVSGHEFAVRQLATLEDLSENIRKQRAENPAGENELYAKWQQGQYMYSMFTTQHQQVANDRYSDLSWTSSVDFLKTFMRFD